MRADIGRIYSLSSTAELKRAAGERTGTKYWYDADHLLCSTMSHDGATNNAASTSRHLHITVYLHGQILSFVNTAKYN